MTRPTRALLDMTLRLHVVSDLHVEFGNPIPDPVEDADLIVLAGDLAPYRPAVVRELVRAWGEKRVLYVPGNHEFYGGDIDHVRAALARQCLEVGIDLLDRASRCIRGVRFIGATLWTDFNLYGVECAFAFKDLAQHGMSDFHVIGHRGRAFTPEESTRRHAADLRFIDRELRHAQEAGETAVVITHHAPTGQSVHPRFFGSNLNPAFASDLERMIATYQPALWIHGHMHNSVDLRLGETRVLANPGAYSPEENTEYDPALCVAVATELV